MSFNPAGLVYGTILVATLLAAESPRRETYVRTVGAVVIALLLYWLAMAYAHFTGERLRRGEHFELAEFARTVGHEVGVLLGALVPLLVLAISWAAGASLSAGVSAAIWTAVGIIVAIEVGIGIRSELTGRELLVQSAFGMLLGVLVLVLRVLLH